MSTAERRDRWLNHARLALLSLVCIAISVPASAQYVNNICVSMLGTTCMVNPAPIGSQCGCFTPYGPSPGQIAPPFAQPQLQQNFSPMSEACQTFRGICRTYAARLGSPCACFGDPGSIVLR